MEKSNHQKILELLKCKSSIKQQIYRNTLEVFGLLKKVLSKTASNLHQDYSIKDPSVELMYRETGQFEAELKFSGDMLLISMHTNVFNFEEGHSIFQTSYIKEDPSLSYCGVIYIHNFLADSVKYNRLADEGTLLARILINKEKHFLVEGEGSLGFLYEVFGEAVISETTLTDIIEKSILLCLNTDLQLPRFAQIKDITLHQKQSIVSASGYPTGKRLGYLFNAEVNQNTNLQEFI